MTFEQFINSATDPIAVGLIVGALLSFGVELWPAFTEMSSRSKRLWTLGLSLAVPVGLTTLGLATGVHPGDWADLPTTWYPALSAGVSAFAGATAVHTRRLKAAA